MPYSASRVRRSEVPDNPLFPGILPVLCANAAAQRPFGCCCFSSGAKNDINNCRDILLDIVFPNPDYRPAFSPQASEGPLIALAVPGDLLPPVRPKFLAPQREPPAVPKIAVDEDGDPQPLEDNIGLSRQVGDVPRKMPPQQNSWVNSGSGSLPSV
jgi:hypothetical protein